MAAPGPARDPRPRPRGRGEGGARRAAAAALAWLLLAAPRAAAQTPGPAGAPPGPAAERRLDVAEYRVLGVTRLSDRDLEEALGPFLGEGRQLQDVERARAALEKAYLDRGWQAVAVAIPRQSVREGVVVLEVTEGKVARLRVKGARWFSPADVKRQASSVAEGEVPNFNEILRDIYVLNQLPDRRVVPTLRAGVVPGTIAVDLEVEDRLPLHGTLEVNDRYSASTTHTRLNGSLRYDNLFQLGHALSFSFQLAPERPADGTVYSASYLARFPSMPWLSVTANGVLQDSDVSTLGGIAVTGRGRIAGLRAAFVVASSGEWFHAVTLGLDVKHFFEGVGLGGDALRTPITYWPLSVQYGATFQAERSRMTLSTTALLGLRGLGSSPEAFAQKRFEARGSFVALRAEATRTDEVAGGFELSARLQGQLSPDPLVGPEQVAAGGAESVRGYLEAQAVGDFGLLGRVEVRSPSLTRWLGKRVVDELRLGLFADAGHTGIRKSLPEQESSAVLWSAGGGARLMLLGHAGAALDVGVPLRAAGDTRRFRPRLHLRVWSEF